MKQFAIIGCGHISKRHAENISRVGRLAAVCDIIEEKANDLASAYHANAYYSIEELLEKEKEVEIISVCTPNGFHAEHIIKSLQAGKHVLTEKPMCLTKAAAWQIIETEKYCRRKLFVVSSARYNPLLLALKKALEENILGKLYSFHLSCIWNRPNEYYTDWKGKLFPDGGTLYNQFCHYVDAMVWLFGDVSNVKGFSNNHAHQTTIEFEDTGTVALQMENGILGSFHWSVNAFQKNHEIALTLVAEKGTIRIGGENLQEVQYLESASSIEGLLPGTGKDQMPGSHHKELYDHLIKAMKQDAQIFCGAFEGLKTVETIEKIYKATT